MECKAIELLPRTGILRTAKVLNSDFKGSIVKAYKQLLKVALDIDPLREWYGLVVTYKDTYIGFGADAWNEFLAAEMTQCSKDNSLELDVLPAKRLVVISLEEWDYLVQVTKEYKIGIPEALKKILTFNDKKEPKNQVMLITQVLPRTYLLKTMQIEYLDKAVSQIEPNLTPGTN